MFEIMTGNDFSVTANIPDFRLNKSVKIKMGKTK